MKGYRLSIVRHGRTNANSEGIYIGVTDIPLSDEGIQELEERYADNEYPKVQRIYSSPLMRCIQSADILFPDREIVVMDNFREMDFGDFEGKNVKKLVKDDNYKRWLQGNNNGASPLTAAPPNGESLEKLLVRTFEGIDLLLKNMMQDGLTHCALVTHSGVMMNLLACLGIPKLQPLQFACEAGEGFEILMTAAMWQRDKAFEILGKIPGVGEDSTMELHESLEVDE